MAHSGTRAGTLGPGDEIGGHRLIKQIGEGGMGVVYLAEHKLMGRQAAIKVLLPIYSAEPELTSRFFNEARAATAIRHAGIVEIYDFGHQPDGTAYIVMEFLEGEPLEARIRRLGRVSLGNTLHAARQIASALSAAHSKGIVHRDLKPDNIFLVPDRDMPAGERIKVLDFGIAKLTESENTSSSVKTRTGVVMGTPAYMSPEQCKGAGEVDHRADLYSLGCIIFEMLCARPPFMAEGAGEVIAKHIYEQPLSLCALNPAVPQPVDELVRRLLAKSPDQRFATAEELIFAIDNLIVATGAVPSISTTHPTVPSPSGVVGVPTPPPMHGVTPAPIQQGYSGPYGAAPAQTGPPQSEPGMAGVGTVALTAPPAPAKSRKPLFIGVALLAVLGVVGGVVAMGGGSGSKADDVAQPTREPPPTNAATTPPVAVKTAPVEAKPPVAVKKPPVAVKKPAQISILIESTPKGASVYQEPRGIRVGKTPYTHTIAPQKGELVFTVVKSGYKNRTLKVSAAANIQESVVLERIARTTTRRRTPKKPPTGTRPRDKPPADRLNPFDKK